MSIVAAVRVREIVEQSRRDSAVLADSNGGDRPEQLFDRSRVRFDTRAQKVETFLRRHEVGCGVQRPMMCMMYVGGRPFWSLWVKEYQVVEEPAEGTFDKP